MIPKTTTRVEEHTSPSINRQIQAQTKANIDKYSANVETITQRLEELENEWDIERTLEVNGSALLLAGLALGVLHSRRWLLLPMFVGGFCLQHALQGWCPPLEVFRRMGIRTAREIDEERSALKALRGDFQQVKQVDYAA